MGQFWESQLFLVEGFGFGWDNHVYYDPTKFKNEPKIGLISEGIDF
jgi:hypothetical protein